MIMRLWIMNLLYKSSSKEGETVWDDSIRDLRTVYTSQKHTI